MALLQSKANTMASFQCKDLGMDCTWSAKDKSQDKLIAKIAAHAKKAHNMATIDDAMMGKVKAAIKQ